MSVNSVENNAKKGKGKIQTLSIDNQATMIIAALLAGGTGTRMNSATPKQFMTLGDGRSVLEHTVEAFEQNNDIDEICIVMNPDGIETTRQMAQRCGWQKVKNVIAGGAERYLSSLAAIELLMERDDDSFHLLLHDVARPFVSQQTINDIAAACRQYDAAAVGIPSTDTVWQINPVTLTIQRIPERSLMWRAQTPQAFRFSLLRDAYQRALQDPQFRATDDCGVVARYMPETRIHIVKGEESNRKITFAGDLKG